MMSSYLGFCLRLVVVVIALNSHAHKGERGVWRNLRGEEVNADYEAMMQPSQQHITSCVKVIEWATLEDALPSRHPFSCPIRHAEKRWAYSTPPRR